MTDEEIVGKLLELQFEAKTNQLWKTFRVINKAINVAGLESIDKIFPHKEKLKKKNDNKPSKKNSPVRKKQAR